MSFIKIAALVEERKRFLDEYDIKNPDIFLKDPVAQNFVSEKVTLAEKQIRDYFSEQARTQGPLSPELKALEQKMISDLQIGQNNAVRNFSVDRTRAAAQLNPNEFKTMDSLSTQSERALDRSHGKEFGAGIGAVAGAGLGLLAGKKLPKRNTGLLQQIGGSAVGGGVGGVVGGSIGSFRDEKKTGYHHEDVLAPYEIADKISTRKNFITGT